MAANYAKTVLVQMKLIDEAAIVLVSNDGQGIILIDDIIQLNDKYVESLCRVPYRPGGTTSGSANPGVEVSATTDADLQGMVYYIKHFKRIGRTCKYSHVDLNKVHAIYQQDTEESYKGPEVLPTVDPKDWTNTL